MGQKPVNLGLGVLAITMTAAVATAQACEVSLGIPGNPPLSSLEQNKIKGVIAEVTVLALKQMGCRVKPRQLPYPRMYHWVHGGKIDVATSVRRTPKRAALAHYSPPIITEYTIVMVPKDQPFPLETPDDLKDKFIGALLGYQYPALTNLEVTLQRSRNDTVNILRVARKRLDGALVGSITGERMARELELADRVEFLPKALGAVPLGTALSTEAFSTSMRAAFDAEVLKIQASKRWIAILDANKVSSRRTVWPIVRRRPAS